MGAKLEFDQQGNIQSAPEPGPLTLSGVDVQSVSMQGKDLVIHGRRAALIANAEGRLERQSVYSTTILFGSLRRSPNNKFIAYQELKLLVHPDAVGGFDTALKTIFANGLAELASSAPSYWKCYAQGYFLSDLSADESDKKAAACIEESSLSHADPRRGVPEGVTPPKIVTTVPPTFPAVARELRVQGLSQVHFTVSEHGIPVGFQIMRAVGAGLDEATLRSVSAYTFDPAHRNENAIPADLDVRVNYTLSP